jgi:hypothetical protein
MNATNSRLAQDGAAPSGDSSRLSAWGDGPIAAEPTPLTIDDHTIRVALALLMVIVACVGSG